MLIGDLEPDTGSMKLGANLVCRGDRPAPRRARSRQDPVEILADRNDHLLVRGRQMHVMSYLREYLFRDEQARQPVRTCPRRRAQPPAAGQGPGRLHLVLDEPTNDLDADTLDLLQEALSDYDGTVLLVSHDRDFLDRLVTSTIALEGDGTAIEYAGGYSDYVLQRGPREPAAAAAPRKEAPVKSTPRQRLGYKRERALAELPRTIEALQAEIAALQQALADPGSIAATTAFADQDALPPRKPRSKRQRPSGWSSSSCASNSTASLHHPLRQTLLSAP